MSLPDRAGRFKACILEHGVSETGQNKLGTFVAKFGLLEELAGKEWVPVNEQFEIRGYFYLEKKDGSLNERTIEKVRAATGWNTDNVMDLQTMDMSQTIVQVTLEWDEYEGKKKLKVQWLDPGDASAAGVPQANDSQANDLRNRFGSRLRAMGLPAAAPMPAGRPAPTQPAPAAALAAAAAPAAPARTVSEVAQTLVAAGVTAAPSPDAPTPPAMLAAAKRMAWEAISKAFNPQWTDADCEHEFNRVLSEMFGDQRDPATLTVADWRKAREEGPSKVMPF